MSLLTDFLKLFKWDTTSETDLDEEFNVDKAMNENWDKIDAKAKEHDDNINTLEDVQAEQDSLIQKLKDNMINLQTEENTSLYITDAGTVPASLKVRGNHKQDGTPTLENPIEIETVKNEVNVVVSNKNLMPILTEYWEYTEQGIKNKSRNAGIRLTEFKLKAGQTVKIGFKLITKPSVSTSFTASVNSIVNDSISFYNFNAFNINELYSKSYTATEDVVIRYVMYGNENSDIFEFQMWAELNALTDYVKHEEIKKTLDIQQEMLKEDYFVKEADGWKEVHLRSKRNIKEDIQNAEISGTKNFIFISNLLQDTYKKIPSNTYDTNTISNIASHSSYQDMYDKKIDYGIGISNVGSLIIRCKEFTTLEEYKTALNNDSYYYYYYLETPTKLACTKTQSQVLDQLFELDLYRGINNIYTEEGIALMQLDYSADTKQTVDSLNDRITALEQQLLNTAGSEG